MTLLSAKLIANLLLGASVTVLAFGQAKADSAGEALPDRTPDQWLSHMNSAFAELNYDGVFTYYNGVDLSTLRIVHLVLDGIEHERLVHLNGAPREIVRAADEVVSFLQPGDELVELQGSIPAGPFARAFSASFERVSQHYELTATQLDRVAGRSAHALTIAPKDNYRHGYRIWLDADTGLLLRSELVNEQGQRLEIFQFTYLKISDDISTSALEPDVDERSMVTTSFSLGTPQDLSQPIGDSAWVAGWVPAGFQLATWEVRPMPGKARSVNTLMYSDGLAAFSVFVEKMPQAGAGEMMSRDGATVAVTSHVDGPEDRAYLVTVVGEIPEETARRVARSIHFQGS